MSELLARQRKLQVLLRLRELNQEEAGLHHRQALREQQRCQQRLERDSRRYELAHGAAASVHPEAHAWRLAGIEQLRAAADAAARAYEDSGRVCDETRRQLLRRKLEVRVAENAVAAGQQAVGEWRRQLEQDELLDLQLCRVRGRS